MPSPAQSMALAIAPKFTSALSICGSLGIVLKVLFNESRRKKTMHRIVLGMSICDILASIWYFTGTWAIPAGTMSWFGDGETEKIFWAAGDEEGVSCSFAGFFNQFAVATPLYNSTLAIYYLLVVNYGWSDARIFKIEWIFHIVPVGYALITSIFAVAADLYGHVEWTCWILPSELFDETQELTTIQHNFRWLQWIFLFGAVWSCIIVVTIVFVVLYRKMKSLEHAMARYSYSTTTVSRSGASSSLQFRNRSSKGETRSHNRLGGVPTKKESENSEKGQGVESEGPLVKSDIEEGGGTDVSGDDEESSQDSKEATSKSCDLNGDSSRLANGEEVTEELRGSDAFSNVDRSIKNSAEIPVESQCQQNERTKRLSMVTWIKSKRNSVSLGRNGTNGKSRTRQVRREVAKSKKIAVQGLLYVGAFYITWMFPTISRITDLAFGKSFFAIQFLDTFLIPLQGFFNFMIYIRPSFLNYRRQNEEDGFWKSLKTAVTEIKID